MNRLILALIASIMTAAPAFAIYDYRDAATSTAVASGTSDVAAVAAAVDLRLLGFSVKEDAGSSAAAEFIIRNGTSTAGAAVVYVKLSANESCRDFFGEQGIACPLGIFVDRISGTTAISVYSKQ